MSEVCPHGRNCHMEQSLIETFGTCELSARAKKCGQIMGYLLLLGEYKGLKNLDRDKPIQGTFKLDSSFDNSSVLNTNRRWADAELPIRDLEEVALGKVSVPTPDVVVTLLMHGRLGASAWYFTEQQHNPNHPIEWTFDPDEGVARVIEPVSSVKYYGSRLPEVTKRLIEIETSYDPYPEDL